MIIRRNCGSGGKPTACGDRRTVMRLPEAPPRILPAWLRLEMFRAHQTLHGAIYPPLSTLTTPDLLGRRHCWDVTTRCLIALDVFCRSLLVFSQNDQLLQMRVLGCGSPPGAAGPLLSRTAEGHRHWVPHRRHMGCSNMEERIRITSVQAHRSAADQCHPGAVDNRHCCQSSLLSISPP